MTTTAANLESSGFSPGNDRPPGGQLAFRPARAEPVAWTPCRDAALRAARADGLRWRDVASRLGVSRWSAIERGRKIGAPRPLARPRPSPEDPNRPALPAGHPHSWGALVAGTLLDGVPYPAPVFQ